MCFSWSPGPSGRRKQGNQETKEAAEVKPPVLEGVPPSRVAKFHKLLSSVHIDLSELRCAVLHRLAAALTHSLTHSLPFPPFAFVKSFPGRCGVSFQHCDFGVGSAIARALLVRRSALLSPCGLEIASGMPHPLPDPRILPLSPPVPLPGLFAAKQGKMGNHIETAPRGVFFLR